MSETLAFALLVKPFLTFIIFALLALIYVPIRMAFERWCPDGWFKRLLLYRINGRRR